MSNVTDGLGKYENVVNKVMAKLPSGHSDKFGIDPVTIMIIVQLILSIIEAIKKCRTPQDIVNIAKKQRKGDRTMVTMAVRKKLGRKKFRECGQELVDSIIETGTELTPVEVAEIL